jgi:Zn-dependent protease
MSGVDIFLHWTMFVFPIFILTRGLVLNAVGDCPLDEAALQTMLVFGVYACVVVHELSHLVVARWLGLGVRDVVLYPIGGLARLSVVSNRPWQEIWIAVIGPLVHFAIASALAGAFAFAGLPLLPNQGSPHLDLQTFCNRLLWLNLVLGCLQLTPAFPMDGGRIFRGALALSAERLRATEVAATLSSFIALLALVAGMVWLSSLWWLIVLGIVVHVSAQQELMSVQYYAKLQEPGPGMPLGAPLMVPVDQLVDEDVRPIEPDFTGLIWNPKNRLWIVWRNGQPVSANALVGD